MKVCLICDRSFDDSTSHCSEESHPPLTYQPDRIGLAIGDYEIEQRLRSGAVGELYRARQIASGTSCLVRILPVRKELTSGLLGEARSAAAVYHQNVADVYDSGELGSGEIYIVVADLDGRTLRKELEKVGTLDLLMSIEIIRQASEGLHALHQAGLTHGAVNPENIVLANDRDGSVLVRIQNIDFGNSVSSSIVSNKFSIDSYLGPLKYFAPEQCSGQGASVQTDVYSLGIVFFEMLAGEPPFDAETAAKLIHKHKNESPPDIKINNFDLRMLVTHTLMQSLQKRPEVRHSSANAFARQLRHIEQLATHTSTPPPAGVVPPHRRIPKNSAPAAVIIGTPRELSNSAITEPVRAEIEKESIPPIAVREPEVEKVPVAVVQTGTEVLPDPAEVTPVVAPRGSRLKGLKEKIYAVSEMIAASPLLSRSNTDRETPAVAEVAKPRKIELELPEDDIPSIEQVREAIANEPTAPAQEILPAAVEVLTADEPVAVSVTPAQPLTDPAEVVPFSAKIEELVEVKPVAVEPLEPAFTESFEEALSRLVEPSDPVTKPIPVKTESFEEALSRLVEPSDPVTRPIPEKTESFEEALSRLVEPSDPVTKPIAEKTESFEEALSRLVEPSKPATRPIPEKTESFEEALSRLVERSSPVTKPIPEEKDVKVVPAIEAAQETVDERPAPTGVTPRLPAPVVKQSKPPVKVSVVNRKKHAKPAAVPIVANEVAPPPPPKVLAARAGAMPSDQVAIQMVRAALGKTGLTGESAVRSRPKLVQTAAAVHRPIIIQPGPDEITLVRAPRRRIQVDIDRPVRMPFVAQTEVGFKPTILGKAVTSEVTDEPSRESMFAGVPSDFLPAVSRRSVAIGCGVIALMAVFLFANDSISKLFQSVSPGDSVTASANPAEQSAAPAPVAAVKPTKPAEPRNAIAVPTSEKTTPATEKIAPVKEKTKPAKAVDPPKSAPAEKKAVRATERNSKKPVESTDKPARPKQQPAPARTAPGTRPRVVREPRQE